MARGTELSDFDKGVIVGCHLSGLSSRAIAPKRPSDLDISEEQLHISPKSRQSIKLGDSGGVWTVATGHWSSGNQFCRVMSRSLHYSGPMDVYGCGVYPGNGFCRSVYCQLGNLGFRNYGPAYLEQFSAVVVEKRGDDKDYTVTCIKRAVATKEYGREKDILQPY
ncbi:hypothetical protein PR048_024704 [Dryococelus australis]|uniref:Uncharacterized protein n=1 Tax=Dryococelus australis TaxID=614101 RepID=A0ABQ9GPD0_9NEOP|nr:hypothetical protein PR048_024704 [Dryococelus australis]